VRVALVYPDLLGTYGDSGNATILAQRLRWRGRPAEVTTIHAGEAVPASCDLYVVGGGEDLPQALAARDLGRPGPLHRAVDGGAAVLAVCAGLQILGTSFVGPDGVETEGLGLVDCRTIRGKGARAVGELVVDPHPDSGLPALTGYENHGGRTILGSGARPAGRVRRGIGNGDDDTGGASRANTDGIWTGRIWGSYLHGPALARNPALADLLLTWVVGALDPIDDAVSEDLRTERLARADHPAATAFPAWRDVRMRLDAWRRRRDASTMASAPAVEWRDASTMASAPAAERPDRP
jgi:CobQ-like glutamine amidotransferase family enzyme